MQTDFHFQTGGKFVSSGKRQKHIKRSIDTMELIFIVSGSLGMFEENKKFTLNAGDFLYLFPHRVHGGTDFYSRDLEFFWIHFSGDIEKLAQMPQSGKVHFPSRMANYLVMLLEEQDAADNHESCDLLLALALNESCRIGGKTSENRLAAEALKIIKHNYSQPLSTSKIAKILRCNSDYLGRVFHREYHTTPTAYLNSLRLEKASALLKSGFCSVKEAAFCSGYSDLAYFRRLFRKKYSMTPGEFRKSRH